MRCQPADQRQPTAARNKDRGDRSSGWTTNIHGDDCLATVDTLGDCLVVNNRSDGPCGAGVIELSPKVAVASFKYGDFSGQRASRKTGAPAIASNQGVGIGINGRAQRSG